MGLSPQLLLDILYVIYFVYMTCDTYNVHTQMIGMSVEFDIYPKWILRTLSSVSGM